MDMTWTEVAHYRDARFKEKNVWTFTAWVQSVQDILNQGLHIYQFKICSPWFLYLSQLCCIKVRLTHFWHLSKTSYHFLPKNDQQSHVSLTDKENLYTVLRRQKWCKDLWNMTRIYQSRNRRVYTEWETLSRSGKRMEIFICGVQVWKKYGILKSPANYSAYCVPNNITVHCKNLCFLPGTFDLPGLLFRVFICHSL